jgi:hypothetical protein
MFNALKYNEVLEKSGWSKQQATGLLEVVSDMADQNFATKMDIQLSETKLSAEIRQVETRLEAKINDLETRLVAKINELENRMMSEIKRLDAKIDVVENRIVMRLGILMSVGFTILGTLITVFK